MDDRILQKPVKL